MLYAVWSLNGLFNLLLLTAGVQLIRVPRRGRGLTIGIFLCEIAYYLLFFAASELASQQTARAISARFGVGGGGLSFQVLSLYPVWALIILLFAKDRDLERPAVVH